MSGERYTVDSNILFYALDGRTPDKQKQAIRLLELLLVSEGFLILQSLGELCNSTARKRPDLATDVSLFVSKVIAAFPIVSALPEDIAPASRTRQLHGLQFWDAMLWATARRSGCSLLFSEDMQDGRTLEGIQFLNPFKKTSNQLRDLFS